MRIWIALTLVLLAASSPAAAKDRTGPQLLRDKHDNKVVFATDEAVSTLYPRLLDATRACWVGNVAPGAGTGTNTGAMAGFSSAGREVGSELAADGNSAWIAVRVVGFFGGFTKNFLQIDLEQTDAGSRVVVYNEGNVKAQRQFADEVEHWLNDDVDFCHPQPMMGKKKRGG